MYECFHDQNEMRSLNAGITARFTEKKVDRYDGKRKTGIMKGGKERRNRGEVYQDPSPSGLTFLLHLPERVPGHSVYGVRRLGSQHDFVVARLLKGVTHRLERSKKMRGREERGGVR